VKKRKYQRPLANGWVCPWCGMKSSDLNGMRIHTSRMHNMVPKEIEGNWFDRPYKAKDAG
jgi:hypothetical protein